MGEAGGGGGRDSDSLTVMVTVSGLSARVTNGYGPQEYDNNEKKNKFWQYLQDEVSLSNTQGVGCIFMLDSNSWLGCNLMKSDPHMQNQNGKLFEIFLRNNGNIKALNNEDFCEGNITRSRKVNGKEEKSIIDFILVCNKLLPYANYMYIDEGKKYSLANFYQKKKGQAAKISDHNLIYVDFDLKFKPIIQERRTVFKFCDTDALKKFKLLTSKTYEFSDCFKTNKPFCEQLKSW